MERTVLDACVLFSIQLTDFLLRLASAGSFDPVWSDDILAEFSRNLAAKRPDIPASKIEYRRSEMERAFPAANCTPDLSELANIRAHCVNEGQRKDAHVVATAIAAQATKIVTHNIADFRLEITRSCGIWIVKPDAFCASLFLADPDRVVAAARNHRASMQRHPYDVEAYLTLLAGARMELTQTSKLVATRQDEI